MDYSHIFRLSVNSGVTLGSHSTLSGMILLFLTISNERWSKPNLNTALTIISVTL